MLDLLLTIGVLRRLREHAELLASTQTETAPGLAAGARPADFAAISTTGQTISGPAGLRAVAFFSSSCSVCPGKVAPFLRWVRAARLRPDGVLAVVATESGGADYIAELSGAASVCLEPQGGSVGNAFQLKGFPSFFLLNADGVIVTSAFDPDLLPEPA